MARKGARGRPLRLRLEPLEERIAPAGAITVFVKGGSLFVTGDDLDNDVEIDQVGLPADQYRISSGTDATLINGQAGPLIFDGVTKDFNIKLADGNDALLLDGIIIARNAKIDGGDGDNSESIFADIGGNLQIKNGKGNQFIEIDAIVGKNLSIKNGMGDTEIDLFVGVGGNTSINNHKGEHALDINDSGFVGNLKIKTNSGNTDTKIFDSWVGGNLTMKNGTGTDLLVLEETWVDRNVKINNGHGDTITTLTDDTEVLGNVTIKNKNGNDQFEIDTSYVLGKFNLNNGNGDSTTLITLSELGFNDLGNKVKLSDVVIKSGNGSDGLLVEDSFIGRKLNVNFGNGGSASLISESEFGGIQLKARNGGDLFAMDHSMVWGKTNINTGNDVDEVLIDDSVLGPVLINVGSGNDAIGLDVRTGFGFEDPTLIFGKATLIGGSGDDIFVLGAFNEPGAFVVIDGPALANGGSGYDTLDVDDNGNDFLGTTKDVSIENFI